ncbi:MAG: methyltransferase domain-containing protein [Patescibacteria group bacterium]
MPRRKLQKIKELHDLSNVAEMQDLNLKNKLADFLKNKKPLTLELGCGKGEYTLALAKENQTENFIGIDIQGERLWHGAKIAQEQKLNNVFFFALAHRKYKSILRAHQHKYNLVDFPRSPAAPR